MHTPEALLKKHWGHEAFRPHQKELIDAALQGVDSIGILPTGGGKSICYQIPALLKEGITLVISPLIALMEDQINQLESKNIRALSFSTQGKYSIDELFDNAHYGKFKLLYLAPERLTNDYFIQRLTQLPIAFVAIDEAHCISEWGHDFRPAYRKIAKLRKQLHKVPFMAVTATATPKVIEDIEHNLTLQHPKKCIGSFKRNNIAIQHLDTEDKLGYLLHFFKQNQAPAIVYTWTRKEAENTATYLTNSGIAASHFHGGLNFEEKQSRLAAWKNETTPVMVATSAFGMGIDKANVRNIIHLNFPESIESYYQQIGRVGRDGLAAQALLLRNAHDTTWATERTQRQILAPDFVKKAYKALNNYLQIPYGEGAQMTYTLNFSDFYATYDFHPNSVWAFLKLLEQEGVFSWKQDFNNELKLQVLVSPEEFTTAQDEGSTYLTEHLSRTYHELYHREIQVDLNTLAKSLKQTPQKIQQTLTHLEKTASIRLTAAPKDVWLQMHQPREDQYTWAPILSNLKQRNTTHGDKLKAVLQFISSDEQCKQHQVLTYFGETTTAICGKCSAHSCSAPKSDNEIRELLLNALRKNPLSDQELQNLLSENGSSLVSILRQLAEEKRIIKNLKHQWEYVKTS